MGKIYFKKIYSNYWFKFNACWSLLNKKFY